MTDESRKKLTLAERVEIETTFRRKATANGYSCFPCRGKTGQLKGWPGLVLDADGIEDFSGKRRWVSTAIHVGHGGLVMLDMDIDDEEAMAAVEAAIPEALWEKLSRCPVRRGSGAKEAWLARAADGESMHYRTASQGWDSGDGKAHRLEVFGRASRICMAHGAHTVSDNGRVLVEYSWAGDRGPHNVPLSDLPPITDQDVLTLCQTVNETLAGLGWKCATVEDWESLRQRSQETVYDLEMGVRFKTRDFGEMGLQELEALCRGQEESVRLSASFMDQASVNTSRCMAGVMPSDGRLYVFETSAHVHHRPADADPAARFKGVAEKLAARGILDPDEDGGVGAAVDAESYADAWTPTSPDDVVQGLVDRYCWWPAGSGFVVDREGDASDTMTLGSFRTTLLPWSWEEPVKAGSNRTEKINPVDRWVEHSGRIDVAGHRFLPETDESLVEMEGRTYVNTWHGFPHVGFDVPADVRAAALESFDVYLTHLIPDADERAWFIMWLAAKVQKPWLPNCGVIMVAEEQGAGRGTLFDMLGGVFGQRYVENVDSTQLLGTGGQGAYTDWLASSLIVTCDEVLAGDDSGGAMAWKRREAYEKLKTRVDPRLRVMPIIQKGLPNYKAQVSASFLLATNNANALPLAEDDRRIAVILNGGPMKHAAWVQEALAPWRTEKGWFSDVFSAAVWGMLREVSVSWESVREAPRNTKGRAQMLSANESDLEDILEHVLADVPSDYMINSHLRDRMKIALEAAGLLQDTKNWWVRVQDLLGKVNRFGWRRMGTRQHMTHGDTRRRYTVYYRDGGLAKWEETAIEDRWALIGAAGDMNAKASNLAKRMKDRGLKVVDSGNENES